jgi:hypothetical protein
VPIRRLLAACLAALVLAGPAPGWNKGGHMVTAAIAFAVLKQDAPEAIPRVVALLRRHPQYESLWQPRLDALDRPTAEERDLMLFMQAARWSDDVRGAEEFHEGPWHYINLPYKPPGAPDSIRTRPPDADNIIRAYELNLATARDRAAPAADRAVALCWVFHLIGDAHQPLHTSSMYSAMFPRGDKGGNLFYIRARPGASGITLHKYWDDLIIGSERFQSVRNRATELRLRADLAVERLTELGEPSLEKWVRVESFGLVGPVVYRDGALAGGAVAPTAVALPDDYPARAKAVADRRAVLAGRRIAVVLAGLPE